MDKQMIKWILIAGLVLIIFSMKGTVKKESVAAINGQPCKLDADCPCWGTYNVTGLGGTIPTENATAYGAGIANCKIPSGGVTGTCDMTYCMDIQPVGTWLRDNPWAYLKENSLLTVGIIALGIGLLFWPKM